MKKLLLAICVLAFTACSQKHSPLDGVWECISPSGETLHVYTFENHVGFCFEKPIGSYSQFGRLVFTSDSTGVMEFENGNKTDIKFLPYDDGAYTIKLYGNVDIWRHSFEHDFYKTNEEESSVRSAIAARSTFK